MALQGDRVSINRLAADLGLAKSTVSRALNDYPDISERTKIRVREAAQRSGYRPSSLARSMRRGAVETVGLVLSEPGLDMSNPHLAAFLGGVSARLDAQGLDLLVASAPAPDSWRGVYDRLIDSRKVDGFILTRTESRDPRVRHLRERGISFVTHGRTETPSGHAWYDVDNRGAMEAAVRHLARLGHRRIGFIGGPDRLNFARLRREGYEAGLAELGLSFDPALVADGMLDGESGAGAATALLTLDAPPTALLAVVDAVAFGAMRAARDLGLTVGRDISVIGYDDVPAATFSDPPLTTFNQHSEDAGAAVADMLAQSLAGAPTSALQRLTPARMIRRASDAPPVHAPDALRALIAARRANRGPENTTGRRT